MTILLAETIEPAIFKSQTTDVQPIEKISTGQTVNRQLAAYEFAFANVFSFLPHTRDIKKEAVEVLYNNKSNSLTTSKKPSWLNGISILHGLVSFMLIVLIGLGLRNRFRI